MLALSSICVLCLLMVRIQDMWFVVSLYSKTKPIVVFLSTFNYYYFNGINLFTFDYDMRHSWLFWSTVQLQSKHFCEMLEVCRFLCVFPMYSIVLLPPCKQFIGFPNVSGSLMTLPNRSWFQIHGYIVNCCNVIVLLNSSSEKSLKFWRGLRQTSMLQKCIRHINSLVPTDFRVCLTKRKIVENAVYACALLFTDTDWYSHHEGGKGDRFPNVQPSKYYNSNSIFF